MLGPPPPTASGVTPHLERLGASKRSACYVPEEGVLLVEHADKAVGARQSTAHFFLVLRGRSLTTSTINVCIAVDSEVAYRQGWSSDSWARDAAEIAETVGRRVNVDSTIGEFARNFFDQTAFQPGRFDEPYLAQPWDAGFQNPYAPIAYSLKQYAYRTAHRLPVALTLPQSNDQVPPALALSRRVRDSLFAAPVDSAAIREVAVRLTSEKALTFTYHVGGELFVEIVWDRVSRRFLLVLG